MHTSIKQSLPMYFHPEIARKFAALEQNDKNFRVAAILDRVIIQEIAHLPDPIVAAELGGGAHPDRYHRLFERLIKEPRGHIDWVDISPFMLALAEEYLASEHLEKRRPVITFVEDEIISYLQKPSDKLLDLAIMKYTIDHVEDLDQLFATVFKKLGNDGRLVSTIGVSTPELKSMSVNGRFVYRGEEFPENETRHLEEGERFTVKFFKVSGDPNSGYLEGAETDKYYHSAEKIKTLAQKHGFDCFLGSWKELIALDDRDGEELDQDVLVLRKGPEA